MRFFSSFLSILQKMGQSLMIPVSVLPAAGLVVALGRGLQSISGAEGLNQTGTILYTAGLAIFEQLPLIFAIGVAIGFTSGAGVAALAAAVGYFTLINLLKVFTEMRGLELALNTGVFGGIAIGFLAAWVYNRFHKTQLPQVLGFFAGRRLVPIVMVFATLLLSFVFGFGWPPIQEQINHFGAWVMDSSYAGAFYAAGKRLLIPVGLHHVYYQPFLYLFGEFTNATGTVVHGDSARYFAGDPSAGVFMASEFPLMLFGLPAAALAMVMRARPDRRKAVGGIMLTAALTSILTGITEPIEFAFIFVAPILYVLHVGLAFVSGMLTQGFDIHLGYTFSASLIDFVVGYFNQKNSMMLWLVVGPIMAVLYFVGFYGLIGLLKLKTPGREDEVDPMDQASGPTLSSASSDDAERAVGILAALGGAANIENLEACITRLRVIVKDPLMVDQPRLKLLGAAGLFHDGGKNFQIVYGTKSDHLRELIDQRMKGGMAPAKAADVSKASAAVKSSFAKSAMTVDSSSAAQSISSPLSGRVVPLSSVPDQTFSSGVMGDGVAIEPSEGVVVAPFDATVVQIFKTGHAIGLAGPNGIELLIHVGIDTVKLGGEGFKALVKNGDQVLKGQRLIEFDLNFVRGKAPSILTPIVVTNAADFKSVTGAVGDVVKAGAPLISYQTQGDNR